MLFSSIRNTQYCSCLLTHWQYVCHNFYCVAYDALIPILSHIMLVLSFTQHVSCTVCVQNIFLDVKWFPLCGWNVFFCMCAVIMPKYGKGLETKPNCTSDKIKLTLSADWHTTVLLVLSLSNLLEADYNRGSFMVIWMARMAVSGTGKCLGWQHPVLLLVLAVQTSRV